MVQQTLEHREKSNVTRKDLFQMLIQLRNTGNVQETEDFETKILNDGNSNTRYKYLEFNDDDIFSYRIGQANDFDRDGSPLVVVL